jgi:hypothetical protein
MSAKVANIQVSVGTPRAKPDPLRYGGPIVAFQLRDTEQVPLSIEALTAEGNPAAITTSWTTSDDVLASVTPTGDNEALVVASPTDAPGLGPVVITAESTDTSDGSIHSSTFEIDVVAGDAVVFNVVAGTPEEKPAAPPV